MMHDDQHLDLTLTLQAIIADESLSDSDARVLLALALDSYHHRAERRFTPHQVSALSAVALDKLTPPLRHLRNKQIITLTTNDDDLPKSAVLRLDGFIKYAHTTRAPETPDAPPPSRPKPRPINPIKASTKSREESLALLETLMEELKRFSRSRTM